MFRTLILGLVAVTFTHGQQSDFTPDVAAAHTAESAGNYAKAESLYEQLPSLHRDAVLLQRLGLVRHMQNKFKPAAEAFSEAVKLDPKLWTSYLFLGMDLYRMNEFDEAEDRLTTANRIQPNQAETMFWLGATKLARKEFIPGFQMLESVLKRDPSNAEALRLLAENYATFGTSLLNEVGEKYPDSPAGLIVQGKALEFEGAYGPALDAYRAALALSPNRPGLLESVTRVASRVAHKTEP